MTLTTDPTPDTITTNHPPATPPCGLKLQPTGRAKSETAHIQPGAPLDDHLHRLLLSIGWRTVHGTYCVAADYARQDPRSFQTSFDRVVGLP